MLSVTPVVKNDGIFAALFLLSNQRGIGIMKITDIRVRKVAKQGKMRAIVSVTFDNEFVVHDIKVIVYSLFAKSS